jgi:spermidine synthase
MIGTYKTFLVFSGLLLIVSLIGLVFDSGLKKNLTLIWTPILIPVLLIWGLPGSLKATPNQIYETESAYNYIQVLDQDNYVLLRLNEGQGIHSIYHPLQNNYFGSWEQVLIAPYFNPIPYKTSEIKSMAILGLAAGTTARQASLVYEDIQIDGYEIDPEIVEVGKQYFAMDLPNLHVFVQDGRVGLDGSSNKYQVISVDAYRPPYIPWHLTTKEFFEIVNEHLTEDGVMVINVGRGPTDRRLIDALGTTILSVFPSIHIVDIPNTFNSIIFATKQPTDPLNLARNYDYLLQQENIPSLLLETMQVSVNNIQPGIEQSVVFTDDKAPIEWITNALVLDFIFSDEMETLQ